MTTSTTDAVTPAIDVAIATSDPQGKPVAVGIPFPQGEWPGSTPDCHMISPAGSAVAAAMRPLVTWADGSVRWGVVSFLANEKGRHELQIGKAAPLPGHAVTLRETDAGYELSNGRVTATLARTGPSPISQLTADGHDYLTGNHRFSLSVDSATSEHEPAREITVMHASAICTRLRITGAHHTEAGERKLNYRLDVELWANSSAVRLDYHFFNLEKGQDFLPIDRIAMDFGFSLPGASARHFQQRGYGLYTRLREVRNEKPVAIVADETRRAAHIEDPAMLLDDTEYPFYLRPPRTETDEWLGVTTDNGPSVYACMHEFAMMRPSRIASADTNLTLEVWPERAGTLQLQQGRSRRQSLVLAFSATGPMPAGEVAQQTAAPLHEGRACPTHQWLRHVGEFNQDRVLSPGQNVRFEKFMQRLMVLDMPDGMFDLGDTPDSHYRRTYAPVGYVKQREDTPHPKPTWLTRGALADWEQCYETVWTNNEYDVIHCFATELMRTGRPQLWPTLRQLVRHNIEVDFLHYSDHRWLHRATPAHSADHTSTGAYPSHFWTQGLLQYYCMTGDVDALEVAVALGDKIIENLNTPETRKVLWGFNRELGWPVLALSYLADLTGEERFIKQLDEIIDFLAAFDRENQTGAIKLSSGNALHSFNRQLVDGFFAYGSMIEGIDHYLNHRRRPEIEQWFNKLLDDLRVNLDQAHREGASASPRHFYPMGMAIAYERIGEQQCLDLGMLSLMELFDMPGWQAPVHEVKPVAMDYRALIRFLHHTQELGWLSQLDYQRFSEQPAFAVT